MQTLVRKVMARAKTAKTAVSLCAITKHGSAFFEADAMLVNLGGGANKFSAANRSSRRLLGGEKQILRGVRRTPPECPDRTSAIRRGERPRDDNTVGGAGDGRAATAVVLTRKA